MQQVPTELSQLAALEGCDLSFNFFSGSLPDLSALANLMFVRFRGTGVTSSAFADDGLFMDTEGLANLENLVCLDTTGTLLSETVPEGLCDRDGRYITVDCSNTAPCSCCICNGPDYCDVV